MKNKMNLGIYDNLLYFISGKLFIVLETHLEFVVYL